jgi:hypothetical protein
LSVLSTGLRFQLRVQSSQLHVPLDATQWSRLHIRASNYGLHSWHGFFPAWIASSLIPYLTRFATANRADAESFALDDCSKRTKNAKIVLCFCTNGVEH